jgi:hypothetical protein
MASDTDKLERQLSNLTAEIQRYNRFTHRLWIGIAVGLGTALGASVVAVLVLLILKPLFLAVGLSEVLPLESTP